MNFNDRLRHAWDAFKNPIPKRNFGISSTHPLDVERRFFIPDKSMISSIYNRIAIDVSSIDIKHVRVGQNGRYKETIESGLNQCLTLNPNIDQTGRSMIQDLVITLCEDGVSVLVPVDTTYDVRNTSGFDINIMRIGRIIEWFPKHVKINVYDENKGIRSDVILPKDRVAIIENPLYNIMNSSNSTLKRLSRKISLLDISDEKSTSGKLDLIIQLPYVVKSKTKEEQAEKRRKSIEMQLEGSKYGIAYTDGTEKITQLNRPIENNLTEQVDYLTKQLYNQLGLTDTVFNGTATEQEMLNYYNRTVEPFLRAICESMTRTFLSKTARTQGQRVMYFRDPFTLTPISSLADIADKFTRNEILSTNEVRGIIGYLPSEDPRADMLLNKNLNHEGDMYTEENDVGEEVDYNMDGY